MKEKAIKVFLVDDHAVVRDGLRLLLESEGDMEVLGDAANGREAVQKVSMLKPDVVIMDIAMPELNGIDAIQQIKKRQSSVQILVLSMHSSPEHVFRAFRAGAHGYLLKESAGRELKDAVRAVSGGLHYISNTIADIMAGSHIQRQSGHAGPLDRLSMREREVLQLVVEGHSSSEIAEYLDISVKTVETYRNRLMQKLAISDIPGLVKFAISSGLVVLE